MDRCRSIQQRFRGSAQNVGMGGHLNFSPDKSQWLWPDLSLGCHFHKAATSDVQNGPPGRESNAVTATAALRHFRFAEHQAGEALRTTRAAELDGVRLPGAWGSGSSLRAEPVFGPPCALVGPPPISRGSCVRKAFHRPCDASSREKRPRAASSSLELSELDRHCCRERIPANVFQSCCRRLCGRSRCRECRQRTLRFSADSLPRLLTISYSTD